MFSLTSNFCCVCNAFYLFLFKIFKDANGSVSSRISVGFESSGFRFGNDFSYVVFEFGARNLSVLDLVFYPWIPMDDCLE